MWSDVTYDHASGTHIFYLINSGEFSNGTHSACSLVPQFSSSQRVHYGNWVREEVFVDEAYWYWTTDAVTLNVEAKTLASEGVPS